MSLEKKNRQPLLPEIEPATFYLKSGALPLSNPCSPICQLLEVIAMLSYILISLLNRGF